MLRAVILLGLGCILGGCGYATKELFPEQYQTVASTIFNNRTFYRQVEFGLAEAVKKQIEARTPYKIVNPMHADTIIQGTITDIDQGLISRVNPGAIPEQVEITIKADFEWKDLRTGKVIMNRRGFSATGWYAPTTPVSEPYTLAQHQLVEQLAQGIVSSMRSEDW